MCLKQERRVDRVGQRATPNLLCPLLPACYAVHIDWSRWGKSPSKGATHNTAKWGQSLNCAYLYSQSCHTSLWRCFQVIKIDHETKPLSVPLSPGRQAAHVVNNEASKLGQTECYNEAQLSHPSLTRTDFVHKRCSEPLCLWQARFVRA